MCRQSAQLGRWSASHCGPGAGRGGCIYVGYQSDNAAPGLAITPGRYITRRWLTGTAADLHSARYICREYPFGIFQMHRRGDFSFAMYCPNIWIVIEHEIIAIYEFTRQVLIYVTIKNKKSRALSNSAWFRLSRARYLKIMTNKFLR